MGLYNIYVGDFVCPVCSSVVTSAQTRFGHLEVREYRPGDIVRWNGRKALYHGGRPPNGDFRGAGWAICPSCDSTLFLVVSVRSDKIDGVEPGSVRLVKESDYSSKFVGYLLSEADA